MYREPDPRYLTSRQQVCLGRIAELSNGFTAPVAVGLRGIDYPTAAQLEERGLAMLDWGQYTNIGEAGSLANQMGWRVRLTDQGINAIRRGLTMANSFMPSEGDSISGDEWEVGMDDVPDNDF